MYRDEYMYIYTHIHTYTHDYLSLSYAHRICPLPWPNRDTHIYVYIYTCEFTSFTSLIWHICVYIYMWIHFIHSIKIIFLFCSIGYSTAHHGEWTRPLPWRERDMHTYIHTLINVGHSTTHHKMDTSVPWCDRDVHMYICTYEYRSFNGSSRRVDTSPTVTASSPVSSNLP